MSKDYKEIIEKNGSSTSCEGDYRRWCGNYYS